MEQHWKRDKRLISQDLPTTPDYEFIKCHNKKQYNTSLEGVIASHFLEALAIDGLFSRLLKKKCQAFGVQNRPTEVYFFGDEVWPP